MLSTNCHCGSGYTGRLLDSVDVGDRTAFQDLSSERTSHLQNTPHNPRITHVGHRMPKNIPTDNNKITLSCFISAFGPLRKALQGNLVPRKK